MPSPFYKPSRATWYVELHRKQHNLGRHPSDAPKPKQNSKGEWNPPPAILQAFYELMAAPPEAPVPPVRSGSVAEIIDKYLGWCRDNRASETFEWYRWRLQHFCDYLKKANLSQLLVSGLKPFHLDEFLALHPQWAPGMKHGACRALQRTMRWAEKQGYIDRSPVAHYEKPRPGKRTLIIPPGEFDRMLQNVKRQFFRDLLVVSWETGCRPQESLAVEARHVDLENHRWVFPPDESKGDEWPRVVYLSAEALAITRRLMLKHPEGPLFRNMDGNPWTPFAVNCAFTRLKKKLGKKYSLYAIRHSWATHALARGVDALTVAILLGHRDPSTLAKVYQHLSQSPAYLQEQVRKIRA